MTKTALVVFAHPCQKSYTASLRDSAVKKLKDMGFEVLESDLYKMKFNPVVNFQDFDCQSEKEGLNVAKEMKKAYEKNELEKDIAEEIDKLMRAEYVLFIAPTWCGTFPAIMKGWLERVLLRGAAFDFPHSYYEEGYLKGKKALIICTTGAPKEFYQKKGEHVAGMDINENYRHMMNTFSFVGMESLPVFAGYGVEGVSLSERKNYLNDLEEYLGKIEMTKPYESPELTQQATA